MEQDKHLLENTFVLTGEEEQLPPVTPEITPEPNQSGLSFATQKRRNMLLLFGDKKFTTP